jgi:hypothetical protein
VVTFPQQSLLTTTDNLWNRETPTVFVEDHPRHNYHPSTGEITFGSGKKKLRSTAKGYFQFITSSL